MPVIILSSEEVEHWLRRIDRPQKLPDKILDLLAEIEEKTERAARTLAERGVVDHNAIRHIVSEKLRLGGLYRQYIEGTLTDD